MIEPFSNTPQPQARPSERGITRAKPNKDAPHLEQFEIANQRPNHLKCWVFCTNRLINTVARASTPRAGETNDEEQDWLGRDQRRRLKAGTTGCLNIILVDVSPPNKNATMVGGGAISAPGVDFNSVENPPCK